MTNPVSMTLGPFGFRAHGRGYTDLQRRIETPWAGVPVAQGLDRQQWTGPTAETVTIRGVLFPAEFPASMAGIAAAANAGTPLVLVSGDADEGLIHGLFTIQSLDEDRSYHDAAGRAWRNAYTIALRRYAGSASAAGGIGSLLGGLW